jgi:hypothetical protein
MAPSDDDSPSDERRVVRESDHDIFEDMRAKHYEMYGFRGNGGAWRTHVEEFKVMRAEVADLKTFKTKALTGFALGTSIAGLLCGVLVVVLEHYLK